MAFSGALTLTDLNDYLGPSQACIKPIEGGAPNDNAHDDAPTADDNAAVAGAASTQIAIDCDGSYYESTGQNKSDAALKQDGDKPRERTKLETAQISLDDCLACSGCVTSAESVLITMQSQEEMRRVIEEMHSSPSQRKLLVASISPQTLASLSARYSFDERQTASSSEPIQPIPLRTLLHRIAHFLKARFQFDHVLDTTFARHLSLKEHEREYFERRSNTLKRKREEAAATGDMPRSTRRNGKAAEEPILPMLASACPGWICYAEKTHGELLPYVSRTKSPQQISGVLAKKFIASRLGVRNESAAVAREEGEAPPLTAGVYHVTVMPCYDKKLEASRPDFFEEITGNKEVDCVLTTGELDKLMQDEGFDVQRPVDGEAELDLVASADLTLSEALGGAATATTDAQGGRVTDIPHLPILLDHPGSSSGGYLFNLMRSIWLDWLGETWETLPANAKGPAVPLPQLDVKIVRTSDFTEYVLRAPALPAIASASSTSDPGVSGQQQVQRPILFRAAQCYGFRNLQNLVRKLQRQTGAKSAKGAAGKLVDSDGRAVAGGSRGGGRVARGWGRGAGAVTSAGGEDVALRKLADSDFGGSGRSAPAFTDADEEEAHGYDYVEVMACPGGCVNGGGQLRPPTGAEASEASVVNADADADGEGNDTTLSKTCSKRGEMSPARLDPEGYATGWAAGQTATADPSQDIKMLDIDGEHKKAERPGQDHNEKEIKGWQGTSKEWVRRVERAYWSSSQFTHTPISAVSGSTVAGGTSTPLGVAASKRDARSEDKARILDALVLQQPHLAAGASPTEQGESSIRVQPDSLVYADLLADLVTRELSALSASTASLEKQQDQGELEAALVEARKKLLRTEYRAVKDEMVSGLAVQW